MRAAAVSDARLRPVRLRSNGAIAGDAGRRVRCKAQTEVQQKPISAEGGVKQLLDLPKKSGMPLLGLTGYLFEKGLDLSELHDELGPMFAIDLGLPLGGWSLAISGTDAGREVLSSSDDRFESAWPGPVTRLIGPRERLLSDEEAKPWRKTLSSVLSPEVVMGLHVPIMAEDFTKQIRAIASSGEEVAWVPTARRMAFGVATKAAMARLVSDEELDDLCRMFDNVGVTSALDFGFKDGIPGTPFHASVQSRKRIEAILVSKIRPAIDSPGTLEGDRSVVLRLYQSLVEELEASSTTMTNEEVAAQLAQDVYFLMFAGTDTTSHSLVRCALDLDRHPAWFQKLKDEQDALRAEFGDAIDRTVLSRSSLATAVALEILRRKTPVASVFRRAVRDTVMDGVAIPKGTRVLVSTRVPTVGTGPGTREFDPEHWLKPDGTAAKANDGAGNLAFGVGPRRCVGQSIATVEVIMALVIMAREVDTITVPPEEHREPIDATANHPTGLPVTFTARRVAGGAAR